MANKSLFNSIRGRMMPASDTTNRAGGRAYRMSAEHALAQYAATGCLNATFYASAEDQLATVLDLCAKVEPEFIARTALYARRDGQTKDLPALLTAVLSVRSPGLMAEVFDRVIDTPKMLRNFIQIMRSGVVGRKSLGTLPKRLVREWLESRSDAAIFSASVGTSPSLADIIKMVHPRPATPARAALYAYLIGREHDATALPPIVRAFEEYKVSPSKGAPDVPFQMLTGLSMTTDAWKSVAHNATWQTTRMNLNTFARHGVLEDADMVRLIAERLESEPLIERARALPYQLMAAHAASARDVPDRIRQSLERAMEVSVRNVPRLPGKTWVFVDVSGSMQSPVTGHRAGATTAVRCVDVAALMAAAVLRRNPDAEVIAFHDRVVEARLNPRDSVMTNARLLASLPSGGTNCSAPMAELNRRKEHADTVIYVSDNESWIDGRHGQGRATGTMQEWTRLQGRCPRAKLVCIDIQPNSTTQAVDREDILNVGGFSDAVFGVVSRFASNPVGAQHWVSVINEVSI